MTWHLPHDASERERRAAARAAALADELAPLTDAYDRDGRFPLEHYRRLHEAGHLRLAIPRDHGGEGGSLFEVVLAQEQLGRASVALGIGAAMSFNLIGRLVEEPGLWPAAVTARVLGSLARDGGLINSVVTEPALGSISRGGLPETTATPVAGGWSVSGHKIFVTAAPALRWLVTAVRLPPSAAAPQGELARALVEAPAAGLRFEATWADALSQRSGGSDDAFFDRVSVPDDQIVERQAIGAQNVPPPPNGWWLSLVAVYLGTAQAAVDAAADYAHHRVPSVLGQPLAGQAAIQQKIGRLQATVDAARALLYDTARRWSLQPGQRATLGTAIATAKYHVTHAACQVTEQALDIAGGFSLTRTLPLERFFRDARGGLYQPLQDDLALAAIGRQALARRRPAQEAA